MNTAGVTIMVRDFRGETILRGTVDVRGVLTAAARCGSPLLSGVDVYDDTTFNRKQSAALSDELDALVDLPGDDLTEAAHSLRAALALVHEAPHRYLVFNGD
jgi:hypothetical protein